MTIFGRIGRRLLRWFLLIALIPLLFMGYQGYRFARQAVEREVFLHMQAVAMSKRNAIDQWFHERVTDVRVLTRDPRLVDDFMRLVRHGDSARAEWICRQLSTFQEQSQAYVCVCGYDTSGQGLLCMSDRGQLDDSMRISELFSKALAGDAAMSPIYLHENIGPAMQLASAVRDETGRPLAVLVLTLALAQTLDPVILDTTGLGQTGQAYLVDRDQVMLTPSRFMHHPHPLTHTMDSEGIRRALAGTTGSAVYVGYEQQSVIGAWAYLPGQQWALIAEMDAEEAFQPLARLRRNTIVVAILTFGAAMMVVAVISRSISRPIHRLAEASLDVSRGNLDRTVVVQLNDELGDLAESFNRMVHSLKESQRQLVQSERLAAIGELVASVVHELRNPLSSIKMNLRILQSKGSSDAITAEHFALARAQTERMEQMLSDLLDYSKPIPLNIRPVIVQAFIEEVLRDFQTASELSHVNLTVSVKDPQTEFLIDTERMRQTLLNLLLNAQEAVAEDGQITISATTVLDDQQPSVDITVMDNGRGISPENLAHVFEPFFTTRKQGTGLGLSNARKIVEAHGGLITVESELGKGTVSRIRLPIKA